MEHLWDWNIDNGYNKCVQNYSIMPWVIDIPDGVHGYIGGLAENRVVRAAGPIFLYSIIWPSLHRVNIWVYISHFST